MTTKANLLAGKFTFSYYHSATTRQGQEPHPQTLASRSQEGRETNTHKTQKKVAGEGGGNPAHGDPHTTPHSRQHPPGMAKSEQPRRSEKDRHTGRGKPLGPVRDHAHRTTHQYTLARKKPTDRQASRNPNEDHASHDQSKNRGVRMKPLPTRTTREPDEERGS